MTPLRKAREAQGLTREKLAVLAGVSYQTVVNTELGGAPSLKTAQRLSQALGRPIHELFPSPEQETEAAL